MPPLNWHHTYCRPTKDLTKDSMHARIEKGGGGRGEEKMFKVSDEGT